MIAHSGDEWRLGHPSVLKDTIGSLVRPPDVGGLPAWQALICQGALLPLWDGVAVPADLTPGPHLRALCLAPLVPSHTIVADAAAAWVWGAPRSGSRIDVIYPPGRHRPAPRDAIVARQSSILHAEIHQWGTVAVTAPLRTALDVATRCPPATARNAIRALRQETGLDLDMACRSLELRYRWMGRERARAVLASIEP